jgi:hypothetical protein
MSKAKMWGRVTTTSEEIEQEEIYKQRKNGHRYKRFGHRYKRNVYGRMKRNEECFTIE